MVHSARKIEDVVRDALGEAGLRAMVGDGAGAFRTMAGLARGNLLGTSFKTSFRNARNGL
jgi:hypothetical protein